MHWQGQRQPQGHALEVPTHLVGVSPRLRLPRAVVALQRGAEQGFRASGARMGGGGSGAEMGAAAGPSFAGAAGMLPGALDSVGTAKNPLVMTFVSHTSLINALCAIHVHAHAQCPSWLLNMHSANLAVGLLQPWDLRPHQAHVTCVCWLWTSYASVVTARWCLWRWAGRSVWGWAQ